MRPLKPEPYFDAAYLMHEVKASLLPFSAIESHLHAYLACIIALWRGNAVGDWGYSFALTTEGFPFSPDFEQARTQLIKRDCVSLDDDGDMIPNQEVLSKELSMLFTETRWQDRGLFVSAAADCALMLPGGSIRYAIGKTPGFGSAFELGQNSPLLTDFDTENIYKEYGIIASALEGGEIDLLSPAVIWLSAHILQEVNAPNDN